MESTDRSRCLREVLGGVDRMIAFAERDEDHLLAAKCEDVRAVVLNRLKKANPNTG